MFYETNCTCINMKEWKTLKKGTRNTIISLRDNANRLRRISYWYILVLNISCANSCTIENENATTDILLQEWSCGIKMRLT